MAMPKTKQKRKPPRLNYKEENKTTACGYVVYTC